MADMEFNTTPGATVARELLVAYLNTGETATPVWSPIGKRVTDSSAEYDWGEESSQDILGNTNTTMKKPVIKQTFDPWELDSSDPAQNKIWNLAVRAQNAQALSSQDMLIVHLYAGTAGTAMFAERYSACSIPPSSIGGGGGGNIAMPIEVTYGGERTTGTAAISAGKVTFTADTDAA